MRDRHFWVMDDRLDSREFKARDVFVPRTATGNKHFACQDSSVSQILNLIISNGGKIPSNIKVVVTRHDKRENS